MEPPLDKLPHEATGAGAPPWGELVVQNGRLAGVRRPLETALILIGQAEGCDVRLNVPGVSPLHCVLLHTATGPALRDLQSQTGTLINGKKSSAGVLRDGDVLTVGSFHFRVRLRPRQRRADLEQPESRPADHLEEKRRRLIELRDQTRASRAAFKNERDAHEQQVAETARALAAAQDEVADSQKQAQLERRRLLALRQKLKRRFHRNWAAERAAMQRREAEVAREHRDLEKEGAALRHDREELFRAGLRFNGDMELKKRQLQDAGNQLRQEQCLWEERRARGQTDAKVRGQSLDRREQIVVDAERALADQKQEWEEKRRQLEKETEGLEIRIRNQRRKLLELEQEAARIEEEIRSRNDRVQATLVPDAAASAPSGAPATEGVQEKRLREAESDLERRAAALEHLSCELADQRLYLAEQCQRFAQAQARWQQERDTAADHIEPLAQRLQEREQALQAHEQTLAAREDELRHHQNEVAQTRVRLKAWQARLAARTAGWDGERQRLLANIQKQKERAQEHLGSVASLRQRWHQRRRQELAQLQSRLAACAKLLQQCSTLRDDWLRRGDDLEKDRRALAERTLALEEHRLSYLKKSADPEAVEERLERLCRHWSSEFVSAAQPWTRAREALAVETDRLEQHISLLRKETARLAHKEADLARRETEQENKQLLAEAEVAGARRELESLKNQGEIYERQLRELNDELERLARTLIDHDDPGSLPRAQAA